MQFYLINIRPTASPKVTKSTRNCLLTVDCRNAERAEYRMVFRNLFVTFIFIQIFDQNVVFFTERHQSCRVCLIQREHWRYFRCPV